jgi:hypothetical protein
MVSYCILGKKQELSKVLQAAALEKLFLDFFLEISFLEKNFFKENTFTFFRFFF